MKLVKETKHIIKLTAGDLLDKFVPEELLHKGYLIQMGNGTDCLKATSPAKSTTIVTLIFEEQE
jgi:hypothetical protein